MKRASTSGHFHAVRFYENQESLCRIVADFLGEGVSTGQPALIIATPEHSAGIVRELRARHFDVAAAIQTGDLLILDAQQSLGKFMIDGSPSPHLFGEFATEVLDHLCRGRTDCTVRAYGEMVDVLWKEGAAVAAIKLEMLWNQLAMTHEFSLLCGYAMGNFYKDAAIEEVCDHHSHVVSASGMLAPVNPATTIN